MKTTIIRKQVFETNSSSTHSLSLIDNSKVIRILPYEDGTIIIRSEYLDANEVTNSEVYKAYMACGIYGKDAVNACLEKRFPGAAVKFEDISEDSDYSDGDGDAHFYQTARRNYSAEDFIFNHNISVGRLCTGY